MHPQSAPFTDRGRKGSKRWCRVLEDAVRNAKAKNNNNKRDGRALTESDRQKGSRKAGVPERMQERVHGEAAVENIKLWEA